MSLLKSFMGLFFSSTAKQGISLVKDGKPLTEQEVSALGETADAHEALTDTFAAAVDAQAVAIQKMEERLAAVEAAETQKSKDKEADAATILALQTKVQQLEAAASLAQGKITEVAQTVNKGKTTPLISTPSTADGSNGLVEQKDIDAVLQGYQDAALAQKMAEQQSRAASSRKTYNIQ